MSASILLLLRLAIVVLAASFCHAFLHSTFTAKPRHSTTLFMGKGLNRAKNKQAEMLKKMQLAKQQNLNQDEEKESTEAATSESADNDTEDEYNRLLFAELLAKNPPPKERNESVVKPQTNIRPSKPLSNADANSHGPKIKARDSKKKRKKTLANTKPQATQDEEEEDTPLQQGDTAKRRHFESLVELSTSKPLGAIQAASLVPWVPPFLSEYLVILADPRRQSSDLRQAIQYLSSSLSAEILQDTIVISADSPDEMKSWMTRQNVETSLRLFSDAKLDWMQRYSAVVDDERWSLSVFLLDSNGTIVSHTRQVDPSQASQFIIDMVDMIEKDE